MRPLALLVLPFALGLAACESVLPRKLPDEAPPLVRMEEPLALFEEPDDEASRRELPRGSFSGVVVGSTRMSLDDPAEPPGLAVLEVVENSPGDAAGLEPDDILYSVRVPPGPEQDLVWPSEWRELELAQAPGTKVTVVYDRAGLEREAEITLIRRVRPAAREMTARFRESDRVGVVLRTATEVEARAAGLAPGAGAVVVGLSLGSPWRRAGIVFGDLIVALAERPVDHPQVVLDAIREGGKAVDVTFVRAGERHVVEAALSRRKREVTHVGLPPLFDYEKDRDESEWSILLGLVSHESNSSAWQLRILWFFHFSGGDGDRLEEVDK